ncbi:MAG: 16S rRNA (cytidine(1402)-2'-O)-methyltransferase [Bacteroidales bacterium]|nr:16S rRNA (cytidine(1402)-2'-O)-methyltransferase [Bacteroidales bacterium]
MGKLYIVPTPIGNLEDITLRALRILKEVSFVLAEDTRTSRKLFSHFEISTRLIAYHMHNEHKTVAHFVEQIASGGDVALISDAGTPAISDPGFLLVRECVEAGVEVECLPGATALIPALVNSALPADRFVFEGFLPHKKGRQTRIAELAQNKYTFILYESPHRLLKTLGQLAEAFGSNRRASVSRELSKLYEENKRGNLQELIEYFSKKTVKGEIVIVVEGNK